MARLRKRTSSIIICASCFEIYKTRWCVITWQESVATTMILGYIPSPYRPTSLSIWLARILRPGAADGIRRLRPNSISLRSSQLEQRRSRPTANDALQSLLHLVPSGGLSERSTARAGRREVFTLDLTAFLASKLDSRCVTSAPLSSRSELSSRELTS